MSTPFPKGLDLLINGEVVRVLECVAVDGGMWRLYVTGPKVYEVGQVGSAWYTRPELYAVETAPDPVVETDEQAELF